MKIFHFFILVCMTFSCSHPENKLLGRWKLEEIDYSKYYSEVTDEVKLFFKSKVEAEFRRIKGKTFFEMKEANQLNIEMPDLSGNQIISQGKWTINEAEDSLFFDLNGRESYQIIKLTGSTLFLSTDEMPNRTIKLSKVK